MTRPTMMTELCDGRSISRVKLQNRLVCCCHRHWPGCVCLCERIFVFMIIWLLLFASSGLLSCFVSFFSPVESQAMHRGYVLAIGLCLFAFLLVLFFLHLAIKTDRGRVRSVSETKKNKK